MCPSSILDLLEQIGAAPARVAFKYRPVTHVLIYNRPCRVDVRPAAARKREQVTQCRPPSQVKLPRERIASALLYLVLEVGFVSAVHLDTNTFHRNEQFHARILHRQQRKTMQRESS